MSQETLKDQEIDLSQIGKGITNFFKSSVNKAFDFLFFLIKRKFIIIGLFILGVILGYIFDSKENYQTNMNLIPNFLSNEYLYDKAGLLEEKAKRGDYKFFESIGIKNGKSIIKIELEPIPLVYDFITRKETGNQNFEMIKLMAEDGDLKKILEDETTSKNYFVHKLTIKTSSKFGYKDLCEPILKYLNDNDYFSKQRLVNMQYTKNKIILNNSLLKQVDDIIVQLTKSSGGTNVTISGKSNISDLIEKKDGIIKETQYLRTLENIYDSTIKAESVLNSISYKDPIYLRLKFILPLLFISLYLLGYLFVNTYNSQKARYYNK